MPKRKLIVGAMSAAVIGTGLVVAGTANAATPIEYFFSSDGNNNAASDCQNTLKTVREQGLNATDCDVIIQNPTLPSSHPDRKVGYVFYVYLD